MNVASTVPSPGNSPSSRIRPYSGSFLDTLHNDASTSTPSRSRRSALPTRTRALHQCVSHGGEGELTVQPCCGRSPLGTSPHRTNPARRRAPRLNRRAAGAGAGSPSAVRISPHAPVRPPSSLCVACWMLSRKARRAGRRTAPAARPYTL